MKRQPQYRGLTCPFITVNAHTGVYFDSIALHHPAAPSTSSIILKVDNSSLKIIYYTIFYLYFLLVKFDRNYSDNCFRTLLK